MDVHSKLRGSLIGEPGLNPPPDPSLDEKDSGYSIEVVTTEEELSKIERDWKRLSESAESPNIFMTYDWFRSWNQRRAQDDTSLRRRLNVLVLKKHGAVAGIVPLIYRETSRLGFSIRKLEFVGREADYNDLFWGKDLKGQIDAIVAFLAQTRDQWDLIELRDLRETGNALQLMQEALVQAGFVCRLQPEEDRCPYLMIEGPWSTILSKLSPSSRHTFRNQQARLDRLSSEGLRIRIIENPLLEPALLEKLIALESQKRVRGELSQPFIAKFPEVFRSLFETLGPRGWFCVALMELGDRALAWRLVFGCGDKLWDYQTAYDHTFARLSPGTMLIPALIDYAFAHEFREYDFLRGEESYKMRWATGYHQIFQVKIWSRRWTSQVRAFVYLDVKGVVYRLMAKGD